MEKVLVFFCFCFCLVVDCIYKLLLSSHVLCVDCFFLFFVCLFCLKKNIEANYAILCNCEFVVLADKVYCSSI